MYVQINIGKNVDGIPMSEERWESFKQIIRTSLVSLAVGPRPVPAEDWGEIYNRTEVHTGEGVWCGNWEESAHISLVITEHVADWELDLFKNYLVQIKEIYSQENIALIVGSELV